MEREVVNKDAIRRLNKLSWDKRYYANTHFADGTVGLEVTYYFNGDCYKYKIVVEDEAEMHLLRNELDVNSKLVELWDGRLVSASR